MVNLRKLNVLSPEELEMTKKVFKEFDTDGSGTIDMEELRVALESLGQYPSQEELLEIIYEVDEDESGLLDFNEFSVLVAGQKQKMCQEEQRGFVDAFVAMGGNEDKSGSVAIEKISKVIRDFGLTVPIDALLEELDSDGSGTVDYQEFISLLRTETSQAK